MAMQIDSYTIRHLDAWLEKQTRDSVRPMVRNAMLELIATDEEYWGAQGWWNVWDHARCDRIVENAL
jgi:hypothetical protein